MKKKARKLSKPAKVAKKAVSVAATTALATIPAPTAIVKAPSGVLTVVETVQKLESVRRFVSKCLNTELERVRAKLPPGQKLSEDQRKRLEVDWGTIPGVDKPFLMQPGAEKFCFWLNIRPKYFPREENLGNGHMEIVCQVRFYSKTTGEEVFEGPECSCTTMEDNYRFRFQESTKPAPSKEAAEELKAQGLGKWRSKAEWKGGKKVGEKWVWMERIENPNIYAERNKVRQIGQKRALVKGVRNMGAMSEIFVTNPEEWNIPDDIDEGPHIDETYTEGGRKIVFNDPLYFCAKHNCDIEKCPADGHTQAENEKMDQLVIDRKKTPEQREVMKQKVSSDIAPGNRGAAETLNGVPPAAPNVTEILYSWAADLARIEPDPKLTTDIKRLLAKGWKAHENACIFDGEQFEALKFELSKRGITLRRKV